MADVPHILSMIFEVRRATLRFRTACTNLHLETEKDCPSQHTQTSITKLSKVVRVYLGNTTCLNLIIGLCFLTKQLMIQYLNADLKKLKDEVRSLDEV